MKTIARSGLLCLVLALLATTASAGLYDGWGYKAQIQFTGYDKSETLTNFPALVVLGTNISGFAYGQFRSGMNDLAFTADAAGQTTLNYEIDSWNTNGLSYVWVQVPALTGNATVTAWWGAPGQTAPACATNGATWTNGYAGVWHLAESTGLHSDSTAGRNSGTCNGTITRGATGKIGGADQFGGGRVEIANQGYFNYERTNAITFEAWVKVAAPGANNFILCKELNSGNYTGPYLGIGNDNHAFLNLQADATPHYSGVAGSRNVADGAWHHIVGVNLAVNGGSAADIRVYVDGALETLVTNGNNLGTASIQNTTPVTIGSRAGGGVPLTGMIDEPRISTVARSANWVWAEYMNVASNASAFQTYGAAILNTNGVPPFVINLPPTSVAPGAAVLNGQIVSTGSAPVTVVAVYWGPVDGGTNAALWANTNVYAGSWNQGDALTASVALTPGQDTFYTYAAANAVGGVWATPSAYFTGGALTLAATDASLGSNATDTATVVVSRPATCTNGPLAVYYTLGGAATSGVNYAASPASGSLLIPAGQINAAITLTPLLPLNLNAPMSVTVTLAPGAYVVGAASNVTCTVRQFLPPADYSYTTHDGTITITGYSGAGGAVTLPNTIDGLPVTCIGSNAFYGCTNLTGVTIGTNVTTIEDSAFYACSSLSSVTIPASVTSIADSAFDQCGSLTSIAVATGNPVYSSLAGVLFDKSQVTLVRYPGGKTGSYTIPTSVTRIGEKAFFYCFSLTGVTIGTNVTTIGDSAFQGCRGLTGVTIPGSVTSVGDFAFGFCTSLTSITIGANVASIGDGAFADCNTLPGIAIPAGVTNIGTAAFGMCLKLTAITVDTNNPAYSSEEGVLFDKNQTRLIQCPNGKANYTIPSGVAVVGVEAFEYSTSLTNVVIPASVTNIEESAFQYCSALESVTIPASGLIAIGDSAFYGCNSVTTFAIPASVTAIGYAAFADCSLTNSVTIPDGVTTLGDAAFANCTGLTGVTIGNGVTNIGARMFSDCFDLTTVTFGTNVTRIGDDAFQYCGALAGVTIPASVASLGDEAFLYCGALTNVTIPAGVTHIGAGPFAFCGKLTAITVDTNNPAYCSVDGVLYDKSQTTLVQCPPGKTGSCMIANGVIHIGNEAFCGCVNLTRVTIPDTVASIGNEAFYVCSNITNVTLGTNVASIGDGAFAWCFCLTSVTIPDTVTNLGEEAFFDCYDLANVTIGTNVTRLGANVFKSCWSLARITIPDSVTSIGSNAFWYCPSLGSVTIGAGVTNIEYEAFHNCTNLTSVYFQGNAPNLGADVFTYVNAAGAGNAPATFYYLPGTTGWGTSFGGIPTMLWDPQVACDANFGAHGNQFGFTITGSANLVIVVEACTNLVHPTWAAVGTYILTGGSSCFTDSQWASCPARFYRFRSP